MFKANKIVLGNLVFFMDIFNEELIEEGIVLEKDDLENATTFHDKITEFKNALVRHKKEIVVEQNNN